MPGRRDPKTGRFAPSRPSSPAQRAYNYAERSAYQAWTAIHGAVKGGQKAFRKLLRDLKMKVPHHYRKQAAPKETLEAERKFVEEGLGRAGRYTAHRYPDAGSEEAGVT